MSVCFREWRDTCIGEISNNEAGSLARSLMEQLVRILMVEDDEDNFEIVRELLSLTNRSKYKLTWQSDEGAALDVIRKKEHDLYLIDQNLIRIKGLEILRALKQESFDRPLILLTGFSSYDLDVEAMEAGAWDFLSKLNLNTDTLERSIRYCLKQYRDNQKLRFAERDAALKDAAEAANRAKSQFLANMSHEIRTPLAAIIGYTDLAKDPETSHEQRTHFLEVIERNARHLLDLVNDILDFSKIEAGELRLTDESVDWRRTIVDILQMLRPQLEAKGNIFELKVESKSLPEFIRTDGRCLRQVLLNLLGNAIKFTQNGRIIMVVRSELTENKSVLMFEVSDTGIGIAPSDTSRLFCPYSQANYQIANRFGGTGLGLNISRRIAEALGGSLCLLRSEVGKGSSFLFALPLTAAQNTSRLTLCPSQVPNLDLKVLVIDDSPDNLDLISRFLLKAGMEVAAVDNGREGVELALRENFDVILVDLQMPEMDGYMVVRELCALGIKTPKLALSANAYKESSDLALQAGFDGYLTKPISRTDLINAVVNAAEVKSKAKTN